MAHLHELIDFTVAAYLVHKSKVLFVHHKALQKWLPLGGHIELDEDPEQALFRELEEESGLDKQELFVMSDKPDYKSDEQRFLYTPNQLDIHKINETHWHIGMIYFIKALSDKVHLQKDEHNEIKWLSWKELHNPEYKLRTDLIYSAERALSLEKEYK